MQYTRKDLETQDEFEIAAQLDNINWLRNRDVGKYAKIMICVSKKSNDSGFWYAPFDGIECHALLKFRKCRFTKNEYIDEYQIVKFKGNKKIILGRKISKQDFIII